MSPKPIALLVSLLALPARGASVTSTWLGGDGSWSDAASWSAGIPANTASDSFIAQIDGGDPNASQVTLDASLAIDALSVSAGDALVVTPTGALGIASGPIQDAGTIALQGPGGAAPPAALDASGSPTRISGGGAILLAGAGLAGSSLTNQDDLVAGYGELRTRDPGRSFVNQGVVQADVAGRTLTIGGYGGTSSGVLRATNGATLALSQAPTGLRIDGGTVEALAGSLVQMNDFTSSTGASFSATGGSTISVAGYHAGATFTSDAASEIDVAGEEHGNVSDSTFAGQVHFMADTGLVGTITNQGHASGSIEAEGSSLVLINQGELTLDEMLGSPIELHGGGILTLVDDVASPQPQAPLANVDSQIRGAGALNLVANGGRVTASAGTLTLTSGSLTHTGLFAALPGGVLEMPADATGTGAWQADGGRIHVAGDVETTGNVAVVLGGQLAIDGTMSMDDLRVDATSSIDIEGVLKVAGSIDFDGAGGARYHFGPAASVLAIGSGAAPVGDWSGWQSIEAEGRDLGLVAAGFTGDNFYLPDFVVGADGRVVLRDLRDNGNRLAGGREAIYVDTLVFSDSSGLVDLNGIDLYYNHLVGSPSQIIDVAAPEPSALAWLAAALAALCATSRRAPG